MNKKDSYHEFFLNLTTNVKLKTEVKYFKALHSKDYAYL